VARPQPNARMAPALSRWLGNCLSLVGASRYLSMCVRNVILCRNLCVSMAARRESLIGEFGRESGSCARSATNPIRNSASQAGWPYDSGGQCP
jgi:hypothetical protein